MQRAIQSRFFRRIYRRPKQRDVLSSVIICVYCIYFTICVSAFKHLVGSFSNVIASATRLTCIGRWDCNTFHTVKQRLVLNILPKQREIPFTKFSPKLLASSFTCKSNASKVFNSDTFTLLFSRLNNLFCNSVINNLGVSSFFALKPFRQSSAIPPCGAFRSVCLCLNRTPNLLPMFTVFVKPISRILNTVRSYTNIGQAEVATNKLFHILNILFGNINGLKKVKLTFLVNQVSFSFDVRNVVKIMANKVNLLSAANTPQRNHVVRFVGHYSTIISNTTKRFKCAFSFLVQLISICYFGYLPNKHLRRKVKRSLVRMVNFVMEFVVIENLLLPSYLGNSITNSISFLHRFDKQVSLFISRQKFYFQCQLHILYIRINMQKSFLYQKIFLNLFNFKGVSVSLTSHPHYVMNGFHAP